MADRKRLVLFVEGEGDARAVPVLVKRILTDQNAWQHLALDENPFHVGELSTLTGRNEGNWTRWLAAANKRPHLGGVLLLIDGDARPTAGKEFCATTAARELARRAGAVGGGRVFSVAVVFACQEYESWFLPCIEHLAGKNLPDGRQGIRAGTVTPEGDLEAAPRDAKKWLGGCMHSGYKPTRDQEPLTRMILPHLETIHQRPMRSFQRLRDAMQQLVEAIRSGNHIATPAERRAPGQQQPGAPATG
jgi:Domain of unknown function (DUF4276)